MSTQVLITIALYLLPFFLTMAVVFVFGGGLQAELDCRRMKREREAWKKRDAEISARWWKNHDAR